jgi:hypothetical protein
MQDCGVDYPMLSGQLADLPKPGGFRDMKTTYPANGSVLVETWPPEPSRWLKGLPVLSCSSVMTMTGDGLTAPMLPQPGAWTGFLMGRKGVLNVEEDGRSFETFHQAEVLLIGIATNGR